MNPGTPLIALIVLVCLSIGIAAGWAIAHSHIATDCRLLDGFRFGNSIFVCYEVDDEQHPT